VTVSESDESATLRPAANQPDVVEDTPEPTAGRGAAPGTEGPDDERPADGTAEATPGDSGGVTVNSANSQFGTSEASPEVQSTDDMLSSEARSRAEAVGKSYDSSAWEDSAMTPDNEFRDRGNMRRE
jgi:hypothetical protein